MSQVSSNHEVWSTEQDQFLLQTVLQHLGNGSSQKKAFEETAGKIGRTHGACAFRFNTVLRKQHSDEIRSFSQKKSGDLPSRIVIQNPLVDDNYINNNGLSLQQVLSFINSQAHEVQYMQQQLHDANEENIRLNKELEHLKQVRNKMETLGVNISKMLELINA
ncbi:hypothetical protein [Paenibacillus planticolens]|uniref:Myb-like domain-containing protein n=1 Tax=Paenibacillus planticolens TaxID=2654976 RepID=A0ABX1ZHE8_9BACL|nr:hypothetical protein [Paenibacillus planticolens]NOU99506.1 hypothetical protein [Paenibacillus planticolens]